MKNKIRNTINELNYAKQSLSLMSSSAKLNLLLIIGILFLSLNSVSAADSFGGGVPTSFSGSNYRVYGASINPQFTQPSFYGGSETDILGYWRNFNKEDCKERQDVILMIPPGGCSPSVVRSDLLEEQDVPVFCKVSSIQVNPLIDITKIRSIHFKGANPPGVAGMSYFPARIAVRSDSKLIGSPIADNVGYLVIKLKKTPNEKDMLDWVGGNVTAVVDYDSEGVFGVGQHDFYLTETDEEEWQNQYKSFGFWKGKGYIRLEALDEDSARISIYKDAVGREASVDIKKGETSRDIYLGGYYCAAGMNIKVENIGYPVDTALLRVDDEDLWLGEGSSFLNGKCKVTNLEISEVGGGKASFSCTGAGRFDLILDSPDVNLGGGDKENGIYSVGDKVKATSNGNIYLSYVGKLPNDKSNYIVLIKSTEDSDVFLKKGLASFIARRAESYLSKTNIGQFFSDIGNWAFGFEENLKSEIHGMYPGIDTENIKILRIDEEWEGIKLISKFSLTTQLEENKLLKEYYDNAVLNYEEVFNLYPGEKERPDDNLDPYAVEALYNAADLSKLLGLQSKQIEYLEKLIKNYPNTKLANDAEIELERAYEKKFSADSQAIAYVNNEPHFISLIDLKKPSYEDLGAELEFTVNGNINSLKMKKDVRQLIPGTENPGPTIPIEVLDITETSVKIKYYPPETGIVSGTYDKLGKVIIGKDIHGETMELEIGKFTQLAKDAGVRLVDTNLEKTAKVKIIPKDFGMRTESNFEFKIGIEKRGIKLSPKKTQEMITNLEKNIKNWEDINEKLGKVVTGLKGACFATSAVLIVKNFFSGLSGEAMARNEVMTTEGGWNDKCRLAVGNKLDVCGKGIPASVSKCLLDCNDKINTAVSQYTELIKKENENIKNIENQQGVKQEGGDILDWQGQVNTEELKKRYCETYFKPAYSSVGNVEIKGAGNIPLKDVISSENAANCKVDLDDMKMIVLKSKIDSTTDPVLKDVINNKLKTGLRNTYDVTRLTQNEDAIKNAAGGLTSSIEVLGIEAGKSVATEMHTLTSTEKSTLYNANPENTKVAYYHVPSNWKNESIRDKYLIIGFKKDQGDLYAVNTVDILNNGKLGEGGDNIKKAFLEFLGEQKINPNNFAEANSGYYNNPFKEKVVVKYYGRAPYQGLPAQVPLGKVGQTDGWYVSSDYILSGFGKPYEESGRAANFWICNVGENGLIDGKSRDDCRYYNLGSSADLKFPGLSAGDSAILVSKAEKAIREASSQQGKSRVTINNNVYETELAENGESGNCADFMSPADCNLMFNVCDPVMCPESRCDYGGKYRVGNVIQSGIIGSLLLCLPNAGEGVMIPICLSGVHAGIEGYLSILKSTKDCLNESLATGRNIGICDEIKSIYMCEFFWRQAAPLMDVFIPNIFEAFTGQGVRGGGEYLTIDYAWKNVQNSIDYFKNEYAVNAMKAFNQRSTAGVGEEVCKSFVSAQYPSGDLIGNLLEPDSPVQYHAWFSENVLTEATIPPTSHYKVYYHIYAGKDIGAHYVVYLKNPPDSSMVHTLGTYVVDRNYIPKGQQVDIAKDFTGVAGYQELCISINGQDECGFKQVSTSWAVDELSRQYAAEQITSKDIKTSAECVAGEPSLYSLANPNLQAGAQETISPELYKRGVIRVCSSENPGKSITPSGTIDATNSSYDRWMRVGDCDTSAVGCWLDTKSVQNVLSDAPDLLNRTLSEVKLDYVDKVESVTPDNIKAAFSHTNSILPDIKTWDTSSLDKTNINERTRGVLKELNDVTERGGASNPQKAKALLMIGQIYDEITRKIHSRVIELAKKGKTLEDAEVERLAEKSPITFYEFKSITSGIKVNGIGTNFYLREPKGGIISIMKDSLIDEDVGYYTISTGKWTFYDTLSESNEGKVIKDYLSDKKVSYENGNFIISSSDGEVLLKSSQLYTEILKIESLDEALKMIETESLSGGYSDNSDNKNFIDSLCNKENAILTAGDCEQIKGKSISFVKAFLEKKRDNEFFSMNTFTLGFYESNRHVGGIRISGGGSNIDTNFYLREPKGGIISIMKDSLIDEDVGYYTISTGKWTFYDTLSESNEGKVIKDYLSDKKVSYENGNFVISSLSSGIGYTNIETVPKTTWTYDTAIEEINTILNSGRVYYSQNMDFINQLCEEGLLTSNQCSDIKTNDYGAALIQNMLLDNGAALNRKEGCTLQSKYSDLNNAYYTASNGKRYYLINKRLCTAQNIEFTFSSNRNQWELKFSNGKIYTIDTIPQDALGLEALRDFPGDNFCEGIEYMINILKCQTAGDYVS